MMKWLGAGRERRTMVVPLRRGETGRRGGFALPFAVLAIATVALALYLRHLLASATAGLAVGSASVPLYVAGGVFLLATAAIVVLQSVRMAQRVAGPEYRLIQTLRRIRAGDVSFRVHLRRGDLLQGLAEECNALLDWLNRNPPAGARTGTDVFEIGALEGDLGDAGLDDGPLAPAAGEVASAAGDVTRGGPVVDDADTDEVAAGGRVAGARAVELRP